MLMKACAEGGGGAGTVPAADDREWLARVCDDAHVDAEAIALDFREFEAVFVRERAACAYGATIEDKLATLEVCLARLVELAGTDPDVFERDWIRRGATERTFEQTIELCAGVVRHALAERGLRPPRSMAEAFAIAGGASLLPADLVERLVPLCRFRNRLVHDGAGVDAPAVLGVVRASVSDFARFTAAARGWSAT